MVAIFLIDVSATPAYFERQHRIWGEINMGRDEAFAFVVTMLARHIGVPSDEINIDDALSEDLGLDSVDATELMINLQERTGTQFDVGSLDELATVRAVVDALSAARPGDPRAMVCQ
jgi:acyl carrier protein